jgi:AbiV family abortive infection protein
MVSDEALWAVAKNAIRHWDEADMHFRAQRFASAAASAVYSVEEGGKLQFLTATGEPLNDFVKRNHTMKALLLGGLVFVSAVLTYLVRWSPIMQKDWMPGSGLTAEQQKDVDADHEISAFAGRLNQGEFPDAGERSKVWMEAVVQVLMRKGIDKDIKTQAENFQKLRLLATYVDIDKGTGLARGPDLVDEKGAQAVCNYAALQLLIMLISNHKRLPGLEAYLEEALHSDRVGAAFASSIRDSVIRIFTPPSKPR